MVNADSVDSSDKGGFKDEESMKCFRITKNLRQSAPYGLQLRSKHQERLDNKNPTHCLRMYRIMA